MLSMELIIKAHFLAQSCLAYSSWVPPCLQKMERPHGWTLLHSSFCELLSFSVALNGGGGGKTIQK